MKRIALIIGNSDGIGLGLTSALLERGWYVIGISRSSSPLQNPSYKHRVARVQDDNYPKIVKQVIKTYGPVDICVYCAGVGELLDFCAMEREVEIVNVNLLGMIKTVVSIIPHMIEQGRGHFIGLSSLADGLISAEAPSYHAAKAGFSNYLEGLALALKTKGVFVSNVRFGFVNTKMAKGTAKPFMMTRDQAVNHLLKCMQKKPVRYSAPRIMIPLVKFRNMMLRRQF